LTAIRAIAGDLVSASAGSPCSPSSTQLWTPERGAVLNTAAISSA